MLLFLWLAGHGTLDYFGKPVGSDFTAFWNAGRIADTGDPVRAWEQRLLNDAIRATHGTEYGTAWIYPPVFLLLATPLGALPYLPAVLLWQFLSLAAVAVVLKEILGNRLDTLVALASPLTPMVLANGQNSYFTASLVGAGLLLGARRPLLGGSAFGCLIYKPQLGMIIGPLLLFSRNWRALLGAAAAAMALIGLSILLWGVSCWPAWIDSLRYGRFYMEQGSVGFYKSASLFAMMRGWGAGVDQAYFVQIVGVIGAVAMMWKMRRGPAFVQAAAACAAVALTTPYFVDYDMAVVGIGAAFFYAGVREGFLPYERSVLAFIWIEPWISRPAAQYALLPLGPIATLLLIGIAWRRVRQGIAIPPLTCNVWPVTYPASRLER